MNILIVLPMALGAIIIGAVGYFLYQRSGKAVENKAHHQEASLKALKMQYMHGEITKEEYEEQLAARKA